MVSNRPRNKPQGEEPNKNKKGRLSRLEMLGIGLFFLIIMLYGISKCGEDTPQTEPTVTEETVDSTAEESNNQENNNEQGSTFSTGEEPASTTADTSVRINTSTANAKLYVIIDSLKVRKGPGLKHAFVTYLNYGEEVKDLGERSVLEKIRISVDEVRTAPWVHIQNKKGKEGWAFGAGLQFYPVATETNLQESE